MSEFIINTISMVFLLNKRYMPYYKWMHRAMYSLPVLGSEVGDLLKELAENGISWMPGTARSWRTPPRL